MYKINILLSFLNTNTKIYVYAPRGRNNLSLLVNDVYMYGVVERDDDRCEYTGNTVL